MLSFYLLGAKKIFSFLKKAFLVITVYFIIIALFFRLTSNNQTKNQISVEDKIREYNYQLINDKKIKDNPNGKTIIGIYRAFSCFSFGELCTDRPEDWKKNQQNSLFGKINNLFISTIFTPPASFLYWSYNSLEKAQFIPRTYAAQTTTAYTGIGLRSIQAFYKLWENIRNLSFLIITLVLIGIGFMIMFRTKINPQTVISIENALPKIIISMILITFSYPIAGLMIDIMYISLPIISGLFNNIIDSHTNQFLFDQFINNSAFSVVFDWYFFGKYYSAIFQIISGGFLFKNILAQLGVSLVFFWVIAFLIALFYNPFARWLADSTGDATGQGSVVFLGLTINLPKPIIFLILTPIIGFVLILLIIFLGLLFLSFRIFFFLLSCLFNLIIYIVLAPLYLLLEAIPGKNSFSSWIKNIIGNLAVFPAFLFIILLLRAINNSIILEPQKFFSLPGLINNQSTSTFLASMISIYILLMIPDLLKLVKATIIGKEGLSAPVSAGILFGGVGATLGTVTGFANQFYYLKMGYDTFFGKKQPHASQTGKQEPDADKNPIREAIGKNLGKIFSVK